MTTNTKPWKMYNFLFSWCTVNSEANDQALCSHNVTLNAYFSDKNFQICVPQNGKILFYNSAVTQNILKVYFCNFLQDKL